jgi:hypothetical protein
LVASRIAGGLSAIGTECSADGPSIILPRWAARVDVLEGNENLGNGRAAIFPAIEFLHRVMPLGVARELSAGLSSTLEQAADEVAASWCLLFFPLMKFLFEEKPHDCLVASEPIAPPLDADHGYTLLAGPVQTRGFGDDPSAAGHIGQTLMWERFASELLPTLSAGVHHVRCFAGRWADQLQADIFVDGMAWETGSERLRELAMTFPPTNDARPLYSMKQHLIVRPDDLEGGIERATQKQIAEWTAAVANRIQPEHRGLLEYVLRGILVQSRYGDEAEHERRLLDAGVPREIAGRLVAFLPSAAARVVLGEKVTFSDSYHWRNATTGRAVLRRYAETPVFQAAVATFTALADAGLAGRELGAVTSTSAEFHGYEQAMARGVKQETLRFTDMIHHTDEPVEGEPLNPSRVSRRAPQEVSPAAAAAGRKPWWKLW